MMCGIQGNLLNTLTRDGRGTASPRRRMTSHSGETAQVVASCLAAYGFGRLRQIFEQLS